MAKVAYQDPALTIATAENEIAAAVFATSSPDAAQLARIDAAITAAGQAACTWAGTSWPFLETINSFPTADGTSTYALRTVNTNAMADLQSVKAVFLSDQHRIAGPVSKEEFDHAIYVDNPPTEAMPCRYSLWGDLNMGLLPVPDAIYTVYVSYTKRHSKITSAGSLDSALIIPVDFQWGVYVDGAIWLLKHDLVNPAALSQSPEFVETMRRMSAALAPKDNTGSDNLYSDSVIGTWPNNHKVDEDGRVMTWPTL